MTDRLGWLIRMEIGVLLLVVAALLWRLGASAGQPRAPLSAGETAPASAARRQEGTSPEMLALRRRPLPTLASPRVVVEKSKRRLLVYDGRELVKWYPVAVGAGRGDKAREGDRCTPEGRFYICSHNPASRWTRSLGLSYPNIEDAERGLRDKLISRWEYSRIVDAIRRKQRPPWNTALGGEIMIHGGGSNRDWTQGCIGLDNADILELYAALPDGTAVAIVP